MSIDNRYKYGALSIGVILGLLALALSVSSNEHDEAGASTSERSDAPTSTSPSLAASGAQWRDARDDWRPPRLQGRYALDYRMEMGPSGQAPILTYDLAGELTAIEGEDEGWTLIKLEDVELTAQGETDGMTDLPEDRPERAFEHPLRVQHSANGELQEVLFADEMPQSARATIKGILASAQLIARERDQDERSWAQEESDANGPYDATYSRVGGDLIEKKITLNTDATGPSVYIATGDALFTIKDPARVEALRYGHDARIDMTASGQRVLRVQTQIELSYQGDALDADFSQAALSANHTYDPSAHARRSPQQEDRAMVAGRSFDSLVATVEAASRKETWQERVVARRDLSAMLRLEPERAEQIGAALRDETEHPDIQRSFVEALAGASTPEAQHQLASLAGDRTVRQGLREQVVQASVFVGQPTPEFVATMIALSQNMEEPPGTQEGSLVALGAIVGNLEEGDADAHREQLDALLDRADERLSVEAFAQEFGKQGGADEERNIVRWLEALGNTRAEEILPILDRATLTESSWIKSTAYLAMRHLQSDKSTELVTYGVLHEWDSNVRVKALEAARHLGHDRMLEPCKQALTRDSSKLVRLEAAFTIATWSNEHPEVLELLEGAIDGEAELLVRESLRNYTQPNRNLQEKRSGPSDFQ